MTLVPCENPCQEEERNTTDQMIVFANYVSNKELISRICFVEISNLNSKFK